MMRLFAAVVLVLSLVAAGHDCAKGQECGTNPMKQVILVAKRTGRTLTHVLSILRGIDDSAYELLSNNFKVYAACVGLVDTGYFRKRASPSRPLVTMTKEYHTQYGKTWPLTEGFDSNISLETHKSGLDRLKHLLKTLRLRRALVEHVQKRLSWKIEVSQGSAQNPLLAGASVTSVRAPKPLGGKR